jgi:hypothetical protein
MVYRNQVEALAARKEALEREIAERTHERDEASRLLAQMRSDEKVLRKPPSRWRPLAIGAVIPAIVVVMMLARPSRERDAAHVEVDVGAPFFPTTSVECQRVRFQLWNERQDEGFDTSELDLKMRNVVANWNNLPHERKVGMATICSVMAAHRRHAANARAQARGEALLQVFGLI